jgi:magnesium-transporting ATPase (P-type)
MGRKVAVIGEGITDLPAFESADVSFAMGSGCSLARNRASMVLINDDFQSCIRALLRGRNIYSNIKRFLQFQITVNFSILVCILIGLCYLTESPFNAVMLIWINLIMDVLAALALATAPPLARVISEKAITQDVPILQPEIWRQIYGVTIWNVIVITLVILFGASAFGLEYTNADQSNESVAKRQHFTIIFNTFVFLQFFNQINCRVVGPKDFNVFTNFFNNWIFIFVLALIFFIQWSASHTGGLSLTWMFQTAEIDQQVFWTTVFWGATALVVSAMLKLSPKEWLEKVPIKIDEKNALGANSKLVTYYGKAANKAQVKQNNTNDDDFAPAANSEI